MIEKKNGVAAANRYTPYEASTGDYPMLVNGEKQPPSVVSINHPSLRQTHYGGYVITEGWRRRTYFSRTKAMQAMAHYQSLLATKLGEDGQ
jgi:hypothetical protein